MAKYINPYTDYGFKKLFGEEANKDLLIDFLNELLPPHHQIKELAFKNVENLPDLQTDRKAFFDIHCISVTGERFIVEMQKAKVKFFKDRALFYITFPIREQSQKGDWDFELQAIYFIAVLDFLYEEAEEAAKFRRDVSLKDQDNVNFYDKLHFKFLQMPAFTKQENELETHFDKWAFFLKNLESFNDIPQILKEPIFEKAFETARVSNFTSHQRDEYEQSRLNYIGLKAVSDTAKEEGELKGKEEGKLETKLQIAKEMKKAGESLDKIILYTGLTSREINTL
jgi:predicted transposase/invertase (TIGR01784 family)